MNNIYNRNRSTNTRLDKTNLDYDDGKEKLRSREVSAAENSRFIAKESRRKFDTSNDR